ncbi:MAG TPA: alpha-L-rhamnosidase N-terminal domain-containing protein [Mucilaginibacter sp.]|jgi:hypothetical protein
MINFKAFQVLIATVFLFNLNFSQAQTVAPDLIHNSWKAVWITAQGASMNGYGVYLFRKNIDLPEKPKKFVVFISADNRYKLYVNGQFISAGPARGDITHYNYEIIDLVPYLKAGQNVISAQVWNEAEYRPEAQISLRTGFILQGEGAEEQIINTNKSWKAVSDSSYKPLRAEFPRGIYYVAGPGEFVDMRKHIRNWPEPNFQDSSWSAAQQIEPGTPKYIMFPFINPSTWLLVPSTLPPMELTVQRLKVLRKAIGVTAPNDFPALRSAVTIPANTSATLLLDQGFNTNAYPTLSFSGGKDGGISIAYTETLYTKYPAKGNRNEVENKSFIGRKDSILSDGTNNQTFTSLFWRTYRYVQIKITTKEQPLIIDDFYGTFTGYPFQLKARLTPDQQDMNKMLEIGWRTARLCAFETYTDCPYYEQLQYIGDGRIQAMVSMYNSGDDRLVKNALNQMDESRQPEGITESRHPSYTPQFINTFSLWYIGMLHDYMMYGTDVNFLKDKLPGERQVLAFFRRFQDESGSLKNVPYWSFTDWVTSKGWQFGVAPTGKDGSSAALDMQMLLAYQSAADLENKEGSKGQAAEYLRYADQLAKTIKLKYWDKEKKLFADRPEKDFFSQHVNALAILAGLINGQEALAMGHRLTADSSLAPASIYFKYYLHMALTKAGLGNDYMSWLGKWKENLSKGLTTWAETSDLETTRSDCHAWGASPNIEFFRTILGIDSEAPGFARVKIEPHLGDIKNINGEMPHPKGTISVQYNISHAKTSAKIILPDGVTGTFIWKGKSYPLKPGNNIITLPNSI